MRKIFTTSFLILFSLGSFAQSDSVKIQYLNDQGYFANEKDAAFIRTVSTGSNTTAYRILKIKDKKGRTILRNKNSEYFGPLLVTGFLVRTGYPPNYNNYNLRGSVFDNPFNEMANYFPILEYYSGFYGMGKFKNGLKQGLWYEGEILEGASFFSKGDNEHPKFNTDSYYNSFATGNYAEGKREGAWEYHDRDNIFSGQFSNGEAAGKWTSRKNIIDKKRWYWHGEGDRSVYPVDGNFKNGKPDGYWTQYDLNDEKVISKGYFDNGKYIGLVLYNYMDGKKEFTGEVRNDSIVNRKFFCPLGEEVDVKNSSAHKGYFYETMKPEDLFPTAHTHANGYFHEWDFYTGQTRSEGWYINGRMDSTWKEYQNGKQVSETHYKDGETYGKYWKEDGFEKVNGTYCGDYKCCGIWQTEKTDHQGNTIKEEYTWKDQKQIMKNYWINGKQTVEDGFGIVTSIQTDYYGRDYTNNSFFTEEYYNDGKPFKTISYYGKEKKERAMRSIVYSTPRGDSLAEFWDDYRQKTVSNGNGEVIEYNDSKPYSKIIYENGREFTKVNPPFGTAYIRKILIKKEIKKHTGTNEYEVTITIDKGELTGIAKYSEDISGAQNGTITVTASEGGTFAKLNDKIKFVWVDLPKKSTIELSYKTKDIAISNTNSNGAFKFIQDNKAFDVFLENKNITYMEVK